MDPLRSTMLLKVSKVPVNGNSLGSNLLVTGFQCVITNYCTSSDFQQYILRFLLVVCPCNMTRPLANTYGSLRWHPDKNPDEPELAQRIFG